MSRPAPAPGAAAAERSSPGSAACTGSRPPGARGADCPAPAASQSPGREELLQVRTRSKLPPEAGLQRQDCDPLPSTSLHTSAQLSCPGFTNNQRCRGLGWVGRQAHLCLHFWGYQRTVGQQPLPVLPQGLGIKAMLLDFLPQFLVPPGELLCLSHIPGQLLQQGHQHLPLLHPRPAGQERAAMVRACRIARELPCPLHPPTPRANPGLGPRQNATYSNS